MTRKSKEPRLGFVDYCRVDTNGKVHCNDSEKVKQKFGKTRWLARDEDKWKCLDWDESYPLLKSGKRAEKACRKWDHLEDYQTMLEGKDGPRNREIGGKWSDGKVGAPFFTSTTKVHAPTFGITPGATCPIVRESVVGWLQRAIATGEDTKPTDVVNKLMKEIPRKCLACYATSGNYVYAETQRAMNNRVQWWNGLIGSKEGQDEIVRTMVHAIKHAGDEHCTKNGGCEYKPGVQPKYFRAFDAGDFQGPEDVRVWRRVAQQLPETKFWFPTTVWDGTCRSTTQGKNAMKAALKALHRLPNVTVRPSAKGINETAARVPGLGAGTAVVEKTITEAGAKQYRAALVSQSEKHKDTGSKRLATLCDKDARGNDTNCRTHSVCPGNCALCRKCWDKNIEVVYERHGLLPQPENILKLIKKTTGMEVRKKSSKSAIFKNVDLAIRNEFMKLFAEMTDGPAPPKLVFEKIIKKATTVTPAQIKQIRATHGDGNEFSGSEEVEA